MNEMIQGIEILNEWTETAYVHSPFLNFLIVVGFIIAVIAAIISHLPIITDTDDIRPTLILGGISIICMIVAIIMYCNPIEKIETQMYNITISDQVKFNEFDSKYEVVKREGKIYTIKER